MKEILLAFRSLRKRGQHNLMKITSLSIGLAVGLVLVAKVCFEQSYDSFYPEKERIYQVYEKFMQNGELGEHYAVSGGTVVRMREAIPEIETSTRATWMSDGPFTMTDSEKKLKATFNLADSCLFDILPRPVLQGNPKDVLSRPYYVMVSDKVARQIGGDVVGKTFTIDGVEKTTLTIGGVFEEYPDNSTFRADILVSMPSIAAFMGDGSMNMVGNDRYRAYIKVREHTGISAVEGRLDDFRQQYLPMEEMKKAGTDLTYTFHALTEVHTGDDQVKQMTYLLGLIAFALLFTAVMNYILIVVSSIVNRTKEIAVRKSYGATSWNIHRIIFSEAVVHLLISLVVAFLLLLAFREQVSELVGTDLRSLLYSGGVFIAVVCVLILLVTGLVPGSLFARIPVAAAFRNFRENRRTWKLVLLFVQFVAASFLIILLLVVGRQYERMVNDDPGYTYTDLAYTNLSVLADSTQRVLAIQELKRLPEVRDAVAAFALPIYGAGGDNVSLPGDTKELFNISDLYYVTGDYFGMLEIPVIAGRTFNTALGRDEEVMVSRQFVENMKTTAGWDDNVVGRSICITAHDGDGKAQVICGVYENIRVGSIVGTEEEKGSALFYSPRPYGNLLVRFHRLTPEAIQKAEKVLASIAPDKDIHLYSYADEMTYLYHDTRRFRDSVLAGGIITLLISFIGLVGYTTDEVNRRRKEIALRKINGARLADVLRLFLTDVVRIALPAVLVGAALAFVVAGQWQEQYSEKIPLAWYYFTGGGLAVLLVVLLVSVYNVYGAANENPVNSLKET